MTLNDGSNISIRPVNVLRALMDGAEDAEIAAAMAMETDDQARKLAGAKAELEQLKTLLAEQQAAASEHRVLVAQFAAGQVSESGAAAGEAAAGEAAGGVAAAAPLADSAELERAALAACTPGDVPILGVMRSPCPPGMHGYGCKVRWDLGDRFVPEGGRWLSEFNASHRAVVNCQRGFFDAFAETRARPLGDRVGRAALPHRRRAAAHHRSLSPSPSP